MPRPRLLKNKPLVEAILEIRWQLEPGSAPGLARDPHYKFLLGTLFETVKKRFPHHEELPAASVPEEMTSHVVHHRFRATPNGWPIIQVGPGVFTVNDTVDYVWENFDKLLRYAIPTLIGAHPKPESLRFNMLLLRFINAIALDPGKTNVLAFLSAKMKTRLLLPDGIFAEGHLAQSPSHIATEMAFPCSKPPGSFLVKVGTGQHNTNPALIFEFWFSSKDSDVPRMPEGFQDWLTSAHTVIETTFFNLIEGDLEREFSGDA